MYEVGALSSRTVEGSGGVVLGHGKPIFRGAGLETLQNMLDSMLPQTHNIVPPPRILL
jgi:hypothetical protein